MKWYDNGEEAAFAMKKNRYAVSYDVWDSAICDFDTAYRAHLAKVEKIKRKGKEGDPSNKCKFKFRRYRDFTAKNSTNSFLFKMDKFKSLSKHKVFNNDGLEEKCRRGEFPLVYNEYKKRLRLL